MMRRIPAVGSVRIYPLMLAVALAFSALVLTGYQVWRSQYNTVKSSLLHSHQQALATLKLSLNEAIDHTVQPSFRYLFEAQPWAIDGRVDALKQRMPALQQVMRFDDKGGMLYCIPGPSVVDQYRQWLSAELHQQVQNRDAFDLSIGSFMETIDKQRLLFSFAPIPADLNPKGGWMVLRFAVRPLLDGIWSKLKADFETEQKGVVELLHITPASTDTSTVQVPLGQYLQGWVISYSPDSASEHRMAQQQGLLLCLLIIGLGTLPLLTALFFWWHSRRHVLLAQAKNNFMAHVSHELKSPLALIRLAAETLSMNRISDESRRLQYLSTIIEESDQLDGLIDKVLNYARYEQQMFAFELNSHDLQKTVQNQLQSIQAKVLEKGFTLSVSMPEETLTVPHSPEAIRHVLLNLIDNSIKYTGDGARCLRLHLSGLGAEARLEVLDRGCGLNGASSVELSQPFTRGQAPSADPTAGAGLGLSIVAQAVRAHQGYFELLPRAGGGSIARVCLPLQRDTAHA